MKIYLRVKPSPLRIEKADKQLTSEGQGQVDTVQSGPIHHKFPATPVPESHGVGYGADIQHVGVRYHLDAADETGDSWQWRRQLELRAGAVKTPRDLGIAIIA